MILCKIKDRGPKTRLLGESRYGCNHLQFDLIFDDIYLVRILKFNDCPDIYQWK
jgi:hypothetical protein